MTALPQFCETENPDNILPQDLDWFAHHPGKVWFIRQLHPVEWLCGVNEVIQCDQSGITACDDCHQLVVLCPSGTMEIRTPFHGDIFSDPSRVCDSFPYLLSATTDDEWLDIIERSFTVLKTDV